MWPVNIIVTESIYQTLAAADAAQTANMPLKYKEREIDTVIGRHPKGASVALWFGGMAVTHALTTEALVHWGQPWMPPVWESVTIGFEGETVAWNIHIGMRF